jgi:hypothetical protein
MVERLSDDAVLCRNPQSLWRRTLDGVLVLGPDMSEPLEISAPGDHIWTLLETPMTIADLVTSLEAHFDVAAGTVRTDIEPMVIALQKCGAISVSVPH